jgi:hypothetical protein
MGFVGLFQTVVTVTPKLKKAPGMGERKVETVGRTGSDNGKSLTVPVRGAND